jgi:cytochrome c-type biogenesis protein CcmF
VGPIARWKNARLPDLATRLRWAAAVSVIVALALPFTLGHWSWGVSGGLLLAAWIAATTVSGLVYRLRSAPGQTLRAKLRASSLSYYGMLVAHIGVAVFVVGVTLVKGYGQEKDVRMDVGETVELAGYVFRFGGVREVQGPNYTAARATIEVSRNGKPVKTMYPEKRIYLVQQNPMTEAAIDTGFTRDLYIALGESVQGSAWIVRVQHKPFVLWIWLGAVIMAIGGVLAASDRRYRITARDSAPAEVPPPRVRARTQPAPAR